MLKSKRDESIKRYLSKIGELKHDSKHFSSRYYIITYGEGIKFIVRFSDHFHDESMSKKIDIEIVKTSLGFYTIRILKAGVSYTITEDLVMSYIKSILLIYPEINNSLVALREATKSALQTSVKVTQKAESLEAKLNKRDEFIDLVDEVYAENKNLNIRINNLQGALNDARNKLNNANISVEASKKKLEVKAKECGALKNKLMKFKNLLNSI